MQNATKIRIQINLLLSELLALMRHQNIQPDETLTSQRRTKFAHYCYEITNTSPIDYLNRCRLAHAAHRLVEETDTSITTIAMDAGFSSSQYFARKFKERYKMTARQWRERTN